MPALSSAAGARRGVVAVVTLGALLGWLTHPADASRRSRVVELPVSFKVENTNTSGVSCPFPPDGARYTVRGHIAAPRAALAGPGRRGITVYLTGLDVGESNWRFRSVRGYDWPAELARLGQASLTIDMLGYGASGHPPGNGVCIGSQADVTHQIIAKLRRGDYTLGGRRPARFRRVVLAGHDVGPMIAEVEAYSYHDVDALILVTYADQGFKPFIFERDARVAPVCSSGGEPGAPGYFYMERKDEYGRDLFYNADPAVIAAVVRLREPNPCGYPPSEAPALAANWARLNEIRVPVLIAIGDHDPVWTWDGWSLQAAHFTGSNDVTETRLANTGHFPMLERIAPRFRATVASWLSDRGFGAPLRGPRRHFGRSGSARAP